MKGIKMNLPTNTTQIRELKTTVTRAEEEEDSRTVQLSFSSEAPYNQVCVGPEILDHSEGCVDLARLNEIGVLLFNHDTDKVVGKIERAWTEDGRGLAEVTFDEDPESEKIYQKVLRGTLKGVSVGYVVTDYEYVDKGETSTDGRFEGPVAIAKKWTPLEVSIVSVPADPGVGVNRAYQEPEDNTGATAVEAYARQLEANKKFSIAFRRKGETLMDKKLRELIDKIDQQEAIVDAAKAEGRMLTADEEKRFNEIQKSIDELKEHVGEASDEAVKSERQRVSAITELCKSFDIDPADYIKSGTSEDEARAAVLKVLAERQAPLGTPVRVLKDEGEKFREAATDGLCARMGLEKADRSNPYAHMELKDLAIESLSREGEKSEELKHMSKDDLFTEVVRRAFNPTSAFASILDNTVDKSIEHLYDAVPATFELWTTKGSRSDFKESEAHKYEVGGVGYFERVTENGEVKADKPTDMLLPTRKLDSYAKSFSMTRQAFINDDIGYLGDALQEYAKAAKRTINHQVYAMLLDNAKYADGKAIFDSAHDNLAATASKPDQAGLQAAYRQFGAKKDAFGVPIQVIPKYIIIANANLFDAEVALNSAQVTGSANNDYNPMYKYSDALQTLTEPELDFAGKAGAYPWFMVADPMSAKSIEVDYLNGITTPQVRRMEMPGVLGFHWDVYLDWGITCVDYRGLYKNGGAK